MKYEIYILLIIYTFFAGPAQAQKSYENDPPERIVLNLSDKQAEEMAVTWRTIGENPGSYAEINEADDWIGFAETAKKYPAKNEKVMLDNGSNAFHHSVIFNNLKPSTLYAYRVCSGGCYSEWNQFITASLSVQPFSFVYMGDPQNEIKEYVSRIFRQAFSEDPSAAFWIVAGDLTTEPTLDSLWAELFYAASFIPRNIPFMPAPGNHEYRKNPRATTEAVSKKKGITPLWRPHFTLPENGIKGLEETSYYFDYQDARFIILNGSENIENQLPWLDKILSENKCKWKIITIHQPAYSTGKDRDNPVYREKLVPLYDKYSVDLVLQGHDHTYGRTYKLRDNNVVKDDEAGTVYTVSVSGPKAYELNPAFKDLMARTGEHMQLFQKISIDGDRLTYKSYTVTGKLFDSFVLKK